MEPGNRVVLAEYFTTADLTLLFIVRADYDEPEVVEIRVPLDELRRYVTNSFGATAGGAKVRDLELGEWQERLGPFVVPLAERSPTGDRRTEPGDIIWFVPHDVLHYLPLHALRIGDQYLINRNPICYTPSASVMQYCHTKRKGQRRRALVLGDSRMDLPHAREQALTIAGLFNTTPYLGDQASKSLVLDVLRQDRDAIDIFHFACHGYFRQQDSLQSGIALAPGAGMAPNGAGDVQWDLTAEEIFQLDMKADLVTLSACESGVNERQPGDELIGLTRALIYAGTPSVVVSLWAVDEFSTSILMRAFYQALKAGDTKVVALQRAQCHLQRLTVRDAITYCEDAKKRLTGAGVEVVQQLDRDIADMRFRARDYEAALTDYSRLLKGADASARVPLLVKISQCRRMLRGPRPTGGYETPVYAHPYYWASFVLIGDWQ